MADTWCVYRPEWIQVYTSRCFGLSGREECLQSFERSRKGTVGDGEWRLVQARQPAGLGTWRLELKLPTLKGEWKERQDAEQHRERLGSGAVVVPWGSAEEARLLDYGREPLTG